MWTINVSAGIIIIMIISRCEEHPPYAFLCLDHGSVVFLPITKAKGMCCLCSVLEPFHTDWMKYNKEETIIWKNCFFFHLVIQWNIDSLFWNSHLVLNRDPNLFYWIKKEGGAPGWLSWENMQPLILGLWVWVPCWVKRLPNT